MEQSDGNVSRSTANYYQGIVSNLSRRVAGRGEQVTVRSLCQEVLRRDLKGASRRAYRAAILAHYDHSKEAKSVCDVMLKPDVTRSSSKKSRRVKAGISESAFLSVADVLRENRERWKYADRCLCLIVATNALGLRPCEWAGAEWADEKKSVLRVRNGKFKDEIAERGLFEGKRYRRANGMFREIILPEAHGDFLRDVISDAISAEVEYPWQEHKRGIRRAHDDAKNEAVRKGTLKTSDAKAMYLYGYRHSASAAAKASLDLFAGEVAALLGHRSIQTAQSHYARRHTAKGGLDVRPSGASVLRVADRHLADIDANDSSEVIERDSDHSPSRGSSGQAR